MEAQTPTNVKPTAYRVDLHWGPRGVEGFSVVVEEADGQFSWGVDGDWEPFGGLMDHVHAVARFLGRHYPALRS